jgi:hypothetical protein
MFIYLSPTRTPESTPQVGTLKNICKPFSTDTSTHGSAMQMRFTQLRVSLCISQVTETSIIPFVGNQGTGNGICCHSQVVELEGSVSIPVQFREKLVELKQNVKGVLFHNSQTSACAG